jgi:hypothetical protein
MVSAAEAEGGQPARHAADLTIRRRVSEPPLPVDDRQRVGTAVDHGEKGAAQIKHGPGLDEDWWRGLRGGCSETVSPAIIAPELAIPIIFYERFLPVSHLVFS